MSETAAVRPNCRGCGLPINDPSYITWNGVPFHNDHVPRLEPTWMTRDEIGKTVMETSQVMASGYERAASQFQTDAENDASRKCAIAASNTGYFILQALGFSTDEIKALRSTTP